MFLCHKDNVFVFPSQSQYKPVSLMIKLKHKGAVCLNIARTVLCSAVFTIFFFATYTRLNSKNGDFVAAGVFHTHTLWIDLVVFCTVGGGFPLSASLSPTVPH